MKLPTGGSPESTDATREGGSDAADRIDLDELSTLRGMAHALWLVTEEAARFLCTVPETAILERPLARVRMRLSFVSGIVSGTLLRLAVHAPGEGSR